MQPIPTTEEELLTRALQLRGKTLGELAQQLDIHVPDNFKHAKGWVGQLIEKQLGAYAHSKPLPDFYNLGIELKTIPLNKHHLPQETTFICTAPIPYPCQTFEQSKVFQKLKKVLWVPLEADSTLPIAKRRVATATLWSPSERDFQKLQTDWNELTALIKAGRFTELVHYDGYYLQIRPKAANSRDLIWVLDHNSKKVAITPKGFYLKRDLTKKILSSHYFPLI